MVACNQNVLGLFCCDKLAPWQEVQFPLQLFRASHKNSSTPLSGRGKLTDKVVDSMQNYFGLAIRQNQGDLYGMKKAIGAILWHCTNLKDDQYRHRFCPTGDDSWCKFKKEEQNGSKAYTKSINLRVWIFKLLKPILKTKLSQSF